MAKVLSKSFLLHKMPFNSKTFVVDLLIQEISLVGLVCSLKLIGIKFSIAENAFCFLGDLCIYILQSFIYTKLLK